MDIFLSEISPIRGELSALLAALLWAIASVIFRHLGSVIRPIELNLLKGVIALTLLSLTSLLMGEKLTTLAPLAVLMLMISGAFGIGFGDTMYFESLNLLGPRRTLLLGILAPPLTALIASLTLGETLNWLSWAGILLTILGVAWVITENRDAAGNPGSNTWKGVLFGFLAAFSQAVGAVMSRWALTRTEVSSLQSTVIRLVAGVAFLVLWLLISRQKVGAWIKPNSTPRFWGTILLVVVIGTYLAIWLQQLSFQYTRVGIASTLLATSPVFILPISALLGEKITLRAILGVIISIGGVSLLFLTP